MCFRPSSVDAPSHTVEQGECPTCDMPVAAELGVTGGICPYCGNTIPPGTPYEVVSPDRSGNVRII